MSFFPIIESQYRVYTGQRSADDSEARVSKKKTLAELASQSQQYIDVIGNNYSAILDDPHYRTKGIGNGVKRTTAPRVAIIGAGVAGIVSAYELWRQGFTVDIYEAQSVEQSEVKHIGGRLRTIRLDTPGGHSKVGAEMGAMRFPDRSTCLWKFLRNISDNLKKPAIDSHTALGKFPNPGVVPTAVLLDGQSYTFQSGKKALPVELLSGAIKFLEALGKISYRVQTTRGAIDVNLKVLNKILQKQRPSRDDQVAVGIFWSRFALDYEHMSFGEFLTRSVDEKGAGLDENEMHKFYYLGLGTGGFGPLYPIALAEIYRLIAWDYSDEYQLPISSSSLAQFFYSALIARDYKIPPPLVRSSVGFKHNRINKIQYKDVDEKTRMVEIRGEKGLIKRYDAAIVATSHRAYQFMDLDANIADKGYLPIFPYDPNSTSTNFKIVRAMRTAHSFTASKVFVTAPAPWVASDIKGSWPTIDGQPVKAVLSDTLALQSYVIPSGHKNVNILLSYLWGDESRKNNADINYAETKNLASSWVHLVKESYEPYESLLPFSSFLDKYTSNLPNSRYGHIVWENEPYIHAAFKLPYPGETALTTALAFQYMTATNPSPNTPKVFLAGESCSFNGGWVEGAIISGINASAAVAKVFNVDLIPDVERLFDLSTKEIDSDLMSAPTNLKSKVASK